MLGKVRNGSLVLNSANLETLSSEHWLAGDCAADGGDGGAAEQLRALTSIWLNGNRLSSLDGAPLGALSALRSLHLDNNRLRALPDSIGALASLRELSCEANELAALPDAIGGLAQLQQLSLAHNQAQRDAPSAPVPPFNAPARPVPAARRAIARESRPPPRLVTRSPPHATRAVETSRRSPQLRELPRDALGALGSLRFLRASNNRLRSLPPSLGTLSKATMIE